MKSTTRLTLTIASLFSLSAQVGEVLLEISNFTRQPKEMAELRRDIRGEYWLYNTMGVNGSNNNAWRTEAMFGGSNEVLNCLYRSIVDEIQCGPHVWSVTIYRN